MRPKCNQPECTNDADISNLSGIHLCFTHLQAEDVEGIVEMLMSQIEDRDRDLMRLATFVRSAFGNQWVNVERGDHIEWEFVRHLEELLGLK